MTEVAPERRERLGAERPAPLGQALDRDLEALAREPTGEAVLRVAEAEAELEEDRQVVPLRVGVARDVAEAELLRGRAEGHLEGLAGLTLDEEVGIRPEPEPPVGAPADVSPERRLGCLATGRLGGDRQQDQAEAGPT